MHQSQALEYAEGHSAHLPWPSCPVFPLCSLSGRWLPWHAQPHYSTRSPPASLGGPFSHGGLEVHEGSKLGAIIGLTSFVSCLMCGCSAFGNTFFHIFLAHSGGCRQEASSSTVTLSPLGVEVSLFFIFCPSVSLCLPLSACSYLPLFPPSAFSPSLLPASLSLCPPSAATASHSRLVVQALSVLHFLERTVLPQSADVGLP